jgi:hypothetical protein
MLALTSCTSLAPPTPLRPLPPAGPTPVPLPVSLVTFRVQLPEQLLPGDSIYLTILDEVTGLALNQANHLMQAEGLNNFVLILPFPVGSTLKYRYTRAGELIVQEHFSDGRAVRYRLLKVDGPTVVQDVLSRWTDTEYQGQVGRVQGQVSDASTGGPIPNILITAGSAQALTSADGAFTLDGLPPGIHNLVAYSMDGAYQVFQQGASIAAGSATLADIRLAPSRFVTVDFIVSLPEAPLSGYQVKIAGSLSQLGNTFADLEGGISSLSSRMPSLAPLSDGRYGIRLELPVGADIRYKYTLGDGFWNAEHKENGWFRVRQLIVPENDMVIEDQVFSWGSGDLDPAVFDITVPDYTPSGEYVSIQFNPGHGWTEPIPMWRADQNRWSYLLYSPMKTLTQVQYRFCRSDQCGSADDLNTPGRRASGQALNISQGGGTVNRPVEGWFWFTPAAGSTIVPDAQVRSRGEDFIAGIELQPAYHPSWVVHMGNSFADIASMNANWVLLSPTWTSSRAHYLNLEAVPGADPLWPEILDAIQLANSASLHAGLHPVPRFTLPPHQWWEDAPRDFSFWVAWFNSYRSFILNFAILAEENGASPLILGGEWLQPALPGGRLADGSPSNVPEDAEERWRDLIVEVRERYHGPLLWALPFPEGIEDPPPFLDEFDQLYLLWSAPLETPAGSTEYALAEEAGALLDELVAPLQAELGIPVVLGLSYPSVEGWLSGQLVSTNPGFSVTEMLARPNPDIPELSVSLEEQVLAYNAMFLAVNERDWIGGVVSRGFYPPAILHDKSASIHGKPARAVLWYWFPLMLSGE